MNRLESLFRNDVINVMDFILEKFDANNQLLVTELQEFLEDSIFSFPDYEENAGWDDIDMISMGRAADGKYYLKFKDPYVLE